MATMCYILYIFDALLRHFYAYGYVKSYAGTNSLWSYFLCLDVAVESC